LPDVRQISFFFLYLISFPQPTSNTNLDEDTSASIPTTNEVDNPDYLIQSGSNCGFDHNPEPVCVPNQHCDSSESTPTASDQITFQPAPLELEAGETDTGI
jgi:hypothetical protein